jgi:hypothetical protein
VNAGLTVALISAAVALASIILSLIATRSSERLQANLEEARDLRREQASNKSRLEQVVNRYRDPLLYAANDLQSRIYNIVERDIVSVLRTGDEEQASYVVNSTLFLVAQYLGWVEAIRRGVQYLDLGDDERTRVLVHLLEMIRRSFSSRHLYPESPFHIYRAQQRAIGELMLRARLDGHSGDMLWSCRGYADFCEKLERRPDFKSWFTRLNCDVHGLADDQKTSRARLVGLQHALIDLIDFLDDPKHCVRIPQGARSKIDIP